MSILEIKSEYNKIPLRERHNKSKAYEAVLRKHLKRESQINNILNEWLRCEEDLKHEPFDEDEHRNDDEARSTKDELMRMFPSDSEEEFIDWQETNGFNWD